jgi:ABC-type Fe3+-hydroxamate transport system substrate-binding protein
MRIVSLVPSLTELLFALGLDEQVVGRTGFCIHPRDKVRVIPKVGGTKTVDVEKVRALAPTHLVVNIDENEKPTVDEIARFVPNIVVTHPLTVEDNLALYRTFGATFGRERQAADLVASLQAALDDARARRWRTCSVVYLIWKDPWMTVSADTYIASMLAEVGLRTEAPDTGKRYPEIDWTTFDAAARDYVLFSSEPYRFRDRHLQEFAAAQQLPASRCHLIDGEMASWYGPRAIEALRYMIDYRCRLDSSSQDRAGSAGSAG